MAGTTIGHERKRGESHRRSKAGMAALTVGALGVVFGDIGTSGLYSLQTVFAVGNHAVKTTEVDVYGVLSLVFWTITVVVSVQFVIFVMRADNEGEGGIMALVALVQTAAIKRPWVKPALVAAGLFGVALFFGDGMITPAISVLSAVEGLHVAAPSLAHLVVPITVVVLTILFAIQRFGTNFIGRIFGPVMIVWFVIIGASGLAQIIDDPAVLRALSPSYAITFITVHPGISFIALGAIVLTITGTEALYADMGHFGRPAISRAWFLLVFPALTLNYMGQGSLILETPSAVSNPFFLLIPSWGQIPMVLLATVATVIASQAVISGAFSAVKVAMLLGFLPRLTIRQTSNKEIGQVYAPAINWGLFIAVLALVVAFGSSAGLASAYGVAVTGTLVIDTLLFLVVVRMLWRQPLWLVIAGGAIFLTVNLTFLAGNLTKIFHGGWFPLVIAAVIFTVLLTWNRGRAQVTQSRIAQDGLLSEFLEQIHAYDPPLMKVPNPAVYLTSRSDAAPLALRAGVEHNHIIHEKVVILSMETTKVPYVLDQDRLVLDDLGYANGDIVHLVAQFGFKDTLDVPSTIALAKEQGLITDIDLDNAVYFVSQSTVVEGDAKGMAHWRKRLFVTLARNAASPADYFCLPHDRTITVGSQIEL